MTKIAGAGISGLSCAAKLSESQEVTVFEKSKDLGAKFGQSVFAVRAYNTQKDFNEELKEIGFKNVSLYPIYTSKKFSPSLNCQTLKSKKPLFYNVLRGKSSESIEANLYERCKNNGVEFIFGKAADFEDVDVIATGARDVKITGLGEAPYSRVGSGTAGDYPCKFGYGANFVDASIENNTIYIFYDMNYAPQGYLYVAPFKESVTIASVGFDVSKFKEMPKIFGKALKENKILSEIIDGATELSHFSYISDYFLPKTAIIKGKYYIGEAAGFGEASKGFGFRYALLSGYFAANSILEKYDYDQLWKNSFLQELKEGLKARSMIQKMTNQDYESLIAIYKNIDNLQDYMKKKSRIFNL
ncbi:NAD(P)/FAD-dependent oxidoreductase [Candidatus Micrarchaeota archaeon]|nr:NAD(P)/FAD-dependent oxidoreductase [Candidatus Micrarchaeota archaeon]